MLSLFDAGSRAWPELHVAADVFERYIAERSSAGADVPIAAYAADLYLACACAHGLPGAAAAFERTYGDVLRRIVTRRGLPASTADDVLQSLRARLLVASSGRPKIAEYGGRSALRSWLTITASRAAMMAARTTARRREELELHEHMARGALPDLLLMKRRYAADFSAALARAFERLSNKDRILLSLHILDGKTIDVLGELYKVGRSTAARWLASARRALLEETRRELQCRLGLTDSEYGSLAALVHSQLEVSVRRLLQQHP